MSGRLPERLARLRAAESALREPAPMAAAPAAEDATEVFSAAASTALDEPGWEQPHPRVAP